MAKRQNFVIGSTNQVTESLTDAQLNTAWDQYDILRAGKLDGVFNAVSDFSNDSSNEIANAIQSITGSQPTGASQSELAQALAQMRSEIETTSLSFKGYVATAAPSASTYTLIEGNLWINSATMPTSFPVAASDIKRWDGTAWVNYGSSYTPADFDFFRNINDNEGYYWFGGQWTVMSTDMSTTYFSLNQTSGKWEIKSSVNLPGSPTTTTAPLNDDTTKIATTAWVNANCGANKDLSNLSSVGKNISNWSTNVSNCITEIPQNINLTLSSGTLTLKAASKVYVPNGSGVFNELVFSSDYVINSLGTGTYTKMLVVKSGAVFAVGLDSCYSGSTAPTGSTFAIWYDTANNKVKTTGDSGSTWTDGWSLPVAIVSITSDVISSIDQVFNGFGYVGATVFVLPGVKGLRANGRNIDGTLKNAPFTVNSILTHTRTSAINGPCQIIFRNDSVQFGASTTSYQYDEVNNRFYYIPFNDSNWCNAGTYKMNSSLQVTSFNPKTTFHALDFSDIQNFVYVPDLFDSKWSDHLLNDMNWLRADSFSWQSGTTYSGAYKHLVSDISGKTLQSETIGSTTVQFYLADDGHKICPASQETNVSSIYTATGVAWYYIIDTTNQRFKLPRSKHNKYAATNPVVGTGMTLGLARGTSELVGLKANANTVLQGVDNAYGQPSGTLVSTGTAAGGNYTIGVTTDGTKSGIVAQQTEDTAQYKYLYFYVGNFTQDAITNTAGLNASLFNAKADINLMNTASNVDFVIEKQDPSAENDYTWYRKYKSGWIEQGGYPTTSSTITFPVPMANNKYFFICHYINNSTNTSNFANYGHTPTTTGFSYNNGSTAGVELFVWFVSGMAE